MGITQSGPVCDVCGKLIMPWAEVQEFKVAGYDKMLYADTECDKLLRIAFQAKDWKLLPEGPLKQAYVKQGGVQ